MKVFIGGSRGVSRLNSDIRCRLESIIEKRLPVVVGDASGADKAVQEHLLRKRYDLVEVFCAGGSCRNNLGLWPVRSVEVSGQRRDFEFYAAKDRAMAEEASFGLMIWDGKSVGTLMNVLRLARQRKRVAVYVVPDERFVNLGSEADWAVFLSRYPSGLQERIKHRAAGEQQTTFLLSEGAVDSRGVATK